jgi:hypothetical protein
MAATKSEVVSQLTEAMKASSGVYLADFTGLTVEKVTALRGDLRKKGVLMRVAKNTLVKRALDGAGVTGLDKREAASAPPREIDTRSHRTLMAATPLSLADLTRSRGGLHPSFEARRRPGVPSVEAGSSDPVIPINAARTSASRTREAASAPPREIDTRSRRTLTGVCVTPLPLADLTRSRGALPSSFEARRRPGVPSVEAGS